MKNYIKSIVPMYLIALIAVAFFLAGCGGGGGGDSSLSGGFRIS